MKRVLVYCQAFEDYGDAKAGQPYYKFKYGSDYQCIVPDEAHMTNVLASMYTFISNLNAPQEQGDRWLEFPTHHDIRDVGDLTELEKSYAQHGDVYPWVKLAYVKGVIKQIKQGEEK